ncbi:peptidyl-prolyl cis-trans isomerase [Sporosarcina sp. FA9]|uniref:peptidyl-prolyl cis-trans isomerase n=1 Tax=Sporosarcina sp. FA9 TaxID=3413030 RepID=UPI003F658A0B
MKYERSPNRENIQQRKLKTKPLLILIGLLLLANVFWFIGWLIPDKSLSVDEEVASVSGDSITREEWMTAMEKDVGRETLLGLVNDKVMEAAAKKFKIDVSNEEINLELALIRSVDGQSYTGLEEELALQKIRSNLILEKVLTKDIVIKDELIKTNYEENTSLYNIQTAYRTAIIVLPSKDKAQQALDELSKGSSFEVLAKESSIDLVSASLGGDIGYVNNSNKNIDKEIIAATEKMKQDSLSEVVPLSDGTFAIIKVSEIINGESFKFKEVKEYIRRQLALEQLTESVSPEAFWKEFDAKWFYGE